MCSIFIKLWLPRIVNRFVFIYGVSFNAIRCSDTLVLGEQLDLSTFSDEDLRLLVALKKLSPTLAKALRGLIYSIADRNLKASNGVEISHKG